MRYTVARLGGPADALFIAETGDELAAVTACAWREGWSVRIIGGGANILFSDAGFRGLIIINHARHMEFDTEQGTLNAESGAVLATISRECIDRGLGGFEWAIGIPGTLGGAVVGNAGAHGGDMAHSVVSVTLATPEQPDEVWPVEALKYDYRRSALKGRATPYLVRSALLSLSPGCNPDELRANADAFTAHRKRTQPPGASLGSMFRNPPGDYAGRLIEAAGLKGTRIGGVQISPVHANFFVNTGGGTAADYVALIEHVQHTVHERFGVDLELEVEVIHE